MQNNQISVRYGGALFKLAKELNKIDAIYNDLNAFLTFCSTQICLKEFLAQTFIAKEERVEVINLLAKELLLSEEFINFVSLLIENERTGYLFKIFLEYSKLRDENLGIINIEIVSASKLNDEEKDKIKRIIGKNSGKKPVLHERVDEKILGGYIIKIGDMLYDGSIKTNLTNLYHHLKQGAFVYGS